MIAGCVERMTREGCGSCPRHDPCRAFFSRLFGRRRPAAAPDAPVPAAPGRKAVPPLLAMVGEIARSLEARLAASAPSRFRREVEGRIETLLEAGEARIGTVARELRMSRQTLYRRLKAEGVSFEGLRDGVRRRLALKLISDGVAVKEAAWRLGFSDPSAFSRAFKRWTGKSPRDLRGKAAQPG